METFLHLFLESITFFINIYKILKFKIFFLNKHYSKIFFNCTNILEKFRGTKTINIHVNKDSASEYECVADNSIPPTVSKKIFLNIQCKKS